MSVVVIGSGAAGLAAMRKLHEAGVQAVCLEAADRIGGRVNTVPFAGHVVDLGAQECEGVKNNVIVEMTRPFGLLEPLKDAKKYVIISNGDIMPEQTAEVFVDKLNKVVAAADGNSMKSVACLLDEYIKSEDSTDSGFNNALLEWYKRSHELGGQDGETFGKSLQGLKAKAPCEGQSKMWKGNGMGMILDVLMKKTPNPSDELPFSIQIKKEVNNIDWKNNSKLVKVTCKDGSVYKARSAISTVSIGVLKERKNDLFTPALPTEKIDSINNLNMFVLDKIFMEFPDPWWPKTPAHFDVIWRQEDKEIFHEADKWITEVYAFDTVDGNPNVLVGWINDDGARMMEKTSEDDVKKGMDRLLTKLFEKKFDVKPIKTLLRTKWATNRFERGAYSYRSQHSEEHHFNSETLVHPVLDDEGFPVLCFAGEATSVHHQATVHGAIETGFREADRLIKALE